MVREGSHELYAGKIGLYRRGEGSVLRRRFEGESSVEIFDTDSPVFHPSWTAFDHSSLGN
jgi:hypothetical protein